MSGVRGIGNTNQAANEAANQSITNVSGARAGSEDSNMQFQQAESLTSGYASRRDFNDVALRALTLRSWQPQEGAGERRGASIGTTLRARRQEPELPRVGGLPDTNGLTEDQKYDYYVQLARSRNVPVDETPGQRTLLGLRVSTNTMAQSTSRTAGQGVYDDRMVALWTERDQQGNTVKRVREYRANTEPSAQYDAAHAGQTQFCPMPSPGSPRPECLTISRSPSGRTEGQDANGDGHADPGCLPEGVYTMEADTSRNLGRIGGRVLRPVLNDSNREFGIPVWRDVNHDGNFEMDDVREIEAYRQRLIQRYGEVEGQRRLDAALGSQRTMLIHQGGGRVERNGVVVEQNTYSAGCQTIPRDDFSNFWEEALGNPDPNAPAGRKQRFTYAVIHMR